MQKLQKSITSFILTITYHFFSFLHNIFHSYLSAMLKEKNLIYNWNEAMIAS